PPPSLPVPAIPAVPAMAEPPAPPEPPSGTTTPGPALSSPLHALPNAAAPKRRSPPTTAPFNFQWFVRMSRRLAVAVATDYVARLAALVGGRARLATRRNRAARYVRVEVAPARVGIVVR